MTTTCGICGDLIESRVPSNWHPSKLKRRAESDLQAHLKKHSFAEVLRYEIRQDLDQVPEDERATIVRDIYRNLLGKASSDGAFELNDADSQGVYTIEDALGGIDVYRIWRSANRCARPDCLQH
jgi:hypothetical protein